jgi:hypothetical protein
MAQMMLAVGIDTRGNPVNLYTGEDFIAAQATLYAASASRNRSAWQPQMTAKNSGSIALKASGISGANAR